MEVAQKESVDVKDCIRVTEECFAKIEKLKFS
jgi:hypothetical protein